LAVSWLSHDKRRSVYRFRVPPPDPLRSGDADAITLEEDGDPAATEKRWGTRSARHPRLGLRRALPLLSARHSAKNCLEHSVIGCPRRTRPRPLSDRCPSVVSWTRVRPRLANALHELARGLRIACRFDPALCDKLSGPSTACARQWHRHVNAWTGTGGESRDRFAVSSRSTRVGCRPLLPRLEPESTGMTAARGFDARIR
jgi:hypothetical protein